jgi:K+-sensing histidine kinase KdpD
MAIGTLHRQHPCHSFSVQHWDSVRSTAIGLAFLLRQFEAILTPFLFAVAATVWYAGTGPSVLAVGLSVVSLNYFFLRPFFPSAQ